MTITLPEPLPETVTVGVLALQGAFIEHIHYLQRLRIDGHTIRAIPIRTTDELNHCQALVIPGGESTTIQTLASKTPGLLETLLKFVSSPEKAVWGTCAGMILMASEDGIGGGKFIKGRAAPVGWCGIEGMKVWRNLYGNQLESFEAALEIPCLQNPSTPFNTIFIRAPAIHSLPNDPIMPIETLASLPADCLPPPPPADSALGPANLEDLGKIMVRQGRNMVTSFHPELSGDVRIHQYWVEKCVLGR